MDMYQAAKQADQLQRIADNLKKQGATDAKITSLVNTYLTEKKRKILARENTVN